jgi:hypothetical protein
VFVPQTFEADQSLLLVVPVVGDLDEGLVERLKPSLINSLLRTVATAPKRPHVNNLPLIVLGCGPEIVGLVNMGLLLFMEAFGVVAPTRAPAIEEGVSRSTSCMVSVMGVAKNTCTPEAFY